MASILSIAFIGDTGPLDRRAVFDSEALVDDLLQREEEAPLRDRIVAVHFEDVGTGVDLQVERTVAARPERIARDGELDLDARPYVQRQRNVHPAPGIGFLAVLAFERSSSCGRGCPPYRPARASPLKVTKSAYEMLDLLDSGITNDELVVGGGGDVHIDCALVARNARRARSVDLAVEEIVVLRRGVEHQHLLRGHAHVIGDIGKVLEAHVEIEPAPVASGVEDRNVRRAEAVVLHVQNGFGHRVGHLCKIDFRRESRDVNPSRRGRHPGAGPAAPVRPKRALGLGNTPKASGRAAPYRGCRYPAGRSSAPGRRGVDPNDKRIALVTVGDRHSGAAAGEVPARGEAQRRSRNVVDLQTVEQDVGGDFARAARLHRRGTVGAPLDVIPHAFGDLREGREVEIVQRERHRILAAARGDAVEQQFLLAVHHVELVDHDLRGVKQDFAGVNLPGLRGRG